MRLKSKKNKISTLLNLAERRILTRTLTHYGGSVEKAARHLGVNRTDFYRRLLRTGVQTYKREWGNVYWQDLGKESKEELKLIANTF